MADEEPDYSQYPLKALREAQGYIDRDRYPDRAERVEEETRKRLAQPPEPSPPESPSARRPAWIIIVGILGILFFVSGLVTATGEGVRPIVIGKPGGLSALPAIPRVAPDGTPPWLESLPAWFGPYSWISAGVDLGVAVFYLLGSIRLLRMKPNGPRVLLRTAWASAWFGILKIAITFAGLAFIARDLVPWILGSVLLDLGLVVLIRIFKEESKPFERPAS